MQYDRKDLLDLQLVLKEIVKEVVKICEENDITLFAMSGTALGVYRYQDFIPWDDDADLGMLREDYEKFLSIASDKLSDDYLLECYKNNKYVPYCYAKVKKKGTKFVENAAKNIKINQGIFVDIFPLDFVPSDKKQYKKYKRKVRFYLQLFIAKSVLLSCHTQNKIKKIVAPILRFCLRLVLLPFSKDKIYNKLNLEFRRYNETEKEYLGHLATFRYKYSDIIPVKKAKFGEDNIYVPNNIEEYLKVEYGENFRIEPPKEKQINHAPLVLQIERTDDND